MMNIPAESPADGIAAASPAETHMAQRAPAWRAQLNDSYIKRLRLSEPPIGYDDKGKLVFGSDPACRGYILWDASNGAPPGFGVRVSNKKTYVIRRKVRGKSLMPTVGNFADFKDIGQARARAAELARRMVETGRNPNAIDREESDAELTMSSAMARYREHLVGRKHRPATKDTLRVHDRVAKKHVQWGWDSRKVQELTTQEILRKFDENADAFKSANEQAFRWSAAAVSWCIEVERLASSAERREPRIVANPFDILVLAKRYRPREVLESERQEKSKRNPLTQSATLGPFLEAAWSKRIQNDNETGVHFLILMLLLGCRKSEHAKCVWSELLAPVGGPGVGRNATSHVCIEDSPDWGAYAFLYKTKNGRNHRLPLGPFAVELLRRRQRSAADEAARRGFAAKSRPFVFPARSKLSKSGHYSDAKSLLDALRGEIDLDRLTPHDLRRSFGAIMTRLEVPPNVQRSFLNHADANVTDTYTRAEWALLREWIERIEQAILASAPNVYNALKPTSWPMLDAPPPHVCKPPKPRSGRPRNDARRALATS